MSDSYISTKEIAEFVKPQRDRPAPEQRHDNTKAEAKRIGALLLTIPFFDLVFFFVRVFFALFFATIIYVVFWWVIVLLTLGSGAALKQIILSLIQVVYSL